MGLFGNATPHSNSDVKEELSAILIPGENVHLSFKLIRDLLVFTDKRLILVNKQGVMGKKAEYKSIPYKSISRFSVDTLGGLDMNTELKIWVSGVADPVESLFFRQNKNIIQIQQALAVAMLGE